MRFILLSLLLVSCGKIERLSTSILGNLTYKCSKHGVEYVQSDSGLAVSVDKENKVIKCNH